MKTIHPSGLTLERWNWPFKTAAERLLVQAWINGKPKDLLDENNPF